MFRSSAVTAVFVLLAGLSTRGVAQQHPNLERGFAADKVYQQGDVDTLNVFNGNLNISIPLGAAYPVNAGLSYSLMLSYSGNVWDYKERCDTDCYVQALPNRRSNAGAGWLVSLGRLITPADPTNTSGLWIYESPDESSRVFYPTLHDTDTQVANVSYSRDNTYLRMKDIGSYREVEFPDGAIHKFRESDGKIEQIRDRFGNYVNITYPNVTTWQISDQHGRNHYVYFEPAIYYGYVVDRIELEKFQGGARAVYNLTQTQQTISRSCQDTDPTTGTTEAVPLLTSLTFPDGSTYSMPVADYLKGDQVSCNSLSGHIAGMTLPTLGKIEWEYQFYTFPEGSESRPAFRTAIGVSKRRLENAAGASLGEWTYTTLLNDLPPYPCIGGRREMVNTVKNPLGDKTVHYFSTATEPCNDNLSWNPYEYGLSLTRSAGRPTSNGKPLSRELLDCDAAGNNCTAKQTVFAIHELDPSSILWVGGSIYDLNRRLRGTRVVFNDDSSRFTETDFTSFDGLGHYRQSSGPAGDFDSSTTRTLVTNYNPSVGTYPGSFTMLATTAPWVLNTFTERTVSESGLATSKIQYCFESSTGFLLRERGMSTTTQGAYDLLTVYTRSPDGNRQNEKHYGGDVQIISISTDLCGLTLPSTNQYHIEHTYQYGRLKTSQHIDASGVALSFKTADQDIDLYTGFVSAIRDTAGLQTTLEYDSMGRLAWIKPAIGHDGYTNYVYGRATSPSALASTDVIRRPNNNLTNVVARSQFFYDAHGRVWREKELLPSGTWNARETLYNALGWKTSVSETIQDPGNSVAIGQKTTFTYDALGRPLVVTPSDGTSHNITFAYQGVRSTTRTTKVATGVDVAEVDSSTTETYDRQGRLRSVTEPSGANGANVTTTYSYDASNRLREATTVAAEGTQSRYFNYDGRGLLSSEQHPEKGPSGNGLVTYTGYNALGQATRRIDGATGGVFDHTFTFDRAGRMVSERETVSGRIVRELVYATANGTNNWSNGKVQKATRHNWTDRFAMDVIVTETFTYGGRGGRVSERLLEKFVAPSTVPDQIFRMSFGYNELGARSSVTYPRCEQAVCAGADPARTVTYNYTNGFLTSVPGYATSIAYFPNGLEQSIAHANGVITNQANDPYAMRRPAAISTAGASANWSSGTYQYDGAGNIKRIGSDYFKYDKVNRVVEGSADNANGASNRQSYAFDSFGNMTSMTTTISGTPATNYFAVSPSTNRLTSASYDASGNQLDNGTFSYIFENGGMLQNMRGPYTGVAWGWQPDVAYVYNANDERVWEYNLETDKTWWRMRDLDGKVLREWFTQSANGAEYWTWTRDYVHRDSKLLALQISSEVMYHHLDHLGTPRLITGSGGAQKSRHTYYPFGSEASYPWQNDDYSKFKFTGHERDERQTDGNVLDYMHARYYAPLGGRFWSVDPGSAKLNRPQTWNRYSYVQNNPMNFVDPDGRESTQITMDHWAAAMASGQISSSDYLDTYQSHGALAPFAIAAGFSGLTATAASATVATAIVQGQGLLVRAAPLVASPALQRVVNALFKAGDRIVGGTANAIRLELATGVRTAGRFHIQAGLERLGSLQNLIKGGGLSASDLRAATNMAQDLMRALQPLLTKLNMTAAELQKALASGQLKQQDLIRLMAK